MINQGDFDKIPGNPIAYWITDNIVSAFSDNYLLKDVSILKSGRSTNGENDRLFKFWFEVDFNEITFDALNLNQVKSQYVPLNKGVLIENGMEIKIMYLLKNLQWIQILSLKNQSLGVILIVLILV